MPDLMLISPPGRRELLAQLRPRLGHAVPGLRVIAERVLGADSRIDYLAVEASGRVVLILVGEHDEDLELIGRGLAQRAWVTARLGDWIQLAPHLDLRPDAAVRTVLVCPGFGSETRAALHALGPDVMAAVVYRCIRNGAGFEVLLEHVALPDDAEPGPPPAARLAPDPAPGPSQRTPFRTGLRDSDLGLTPEELREFE